MRRVIESTLVSADGVIGEPHAWTGEHFGEQAVAHALQRLQRSDVMVMGRRTYEMFSQLWATADDEYGARIYESPSSCSPRPWSGRRRRLGGRSPPTRRTARPSAPSTTSPTRASRASTSPSSAPGCAWSSRSRAVRALLRHLLHRPGLWMVVALRGDRRRAARRDLAGLHRRKAGLHVGHVHPGRQVRDPRRRGRRRRGQEGARRDAHALEVPAQSLGTSGRTRPPGANSPWPRTTRLDGRGAAPADARPEPPGR
jgi:hypothetical protein